VIATMRGLAVLGAVALALAIALIAGGPAEQGAIDRTLLPGFRPELVGALAYARTGEPVVTIERTKDTWQWSDGERAPADPTAIDATLTALRGARWHRRASAAAAGTLRGELRVTTQGKTLGFGIGSELPGSHQTWIVHGGHALLVDDWVSRALLPERVALRTRHPLAAADATSSMVAGTVVLAGAHQLKPYDVWVDEAVLRRLTTALSELEIVSLDGMVPAEPALRIELRRGEMTTGSAIEAGTCAGDRVRIESGSGSGCVERGAWRQIEEALKPLTKLRDDVVDQRPLPIAPVKLAFGDGSVLELDGRPRLGADDVDSVRVGELLTALATPGDIVGMPPGTPTATIVASGADRTEVTLLLFNGVVVRKGESFGLRPAPQAWAAIARPPSALRDPVRWREDVITLTALTLDRVTYKRGAVLGEWTRAPPGTFDPALVDALASTLASVRAPAGAAPTAIAHTLAVTFTPPAGAPTTHTVELGPPAADGCAARVDRAPVRLELQLCTAALALAAAH